MYTLALTLLIISSPAVALVAYVVHASRQQKSSRALEIRRPRRSVGTEQNDPRGFVLVTGVVVERAAARRRARGARDSNARVVGARDCVV